MIRSPDTYRDGIHDCSEIDWAYRVPGIIRLHNGSTRYDEKKKKMNK